MSEEITNRFVGPDGEFQPTQQPPEGQMTIGYLEELMEWLYYHNDISAEEKEKDILSLEDMVEDMLKPMNINYRRTWSKKLKEDKNE